MKNLFYNILIISTLYLSACSSNSSIEEKFIAWHISLEHSLYGLMNQSETTLETLKKMVVRNGATAEGRERIKRAEEFKKETARIVAETDKLRRKLTAEAGNGHDPKTGAVINLQAKTKVNNIMLGELGQTWRKKMDDYTNYTHQEYGDLGTANILSLTEDNPDYLKKYFANTSVAEALTLLTERKLKMMEYELNILNQLNHQDWRNDDNFYKKKPFIVFKNSVLEPDEILEAQIHLIEIASKSGAKMTANDTPIKVDGQGIGEVRFVAQGAGWQTWRGSITFNNRGKDTTLFMTKKYYVIPREKNNK